MFNIQRVRVAHKKFVSEHRAMVSTVAAEAGQEAVRYVHKEPHFTPRTGNLQKQTKYRVIRTANNRIIKVRNTAKYAASIDKGSVPHEIPARRAKALRFVKNGQVIFRKSVNHRGTKPTQFLYSAAFQGFEYLGRRLVSETKRIAKTF